MLIHLYRCGERCGIAPGSRRKARTWYVSADTSHLLRSRSLIRYAVSEVFFGDTPLDVRQPPVSAPLPVASRVPRLAVWLAVRHMGCQGEPQLLHPFVWGPQILPARRSGEFDCTVESTRTSVIGGGPSDTCAFERHTSAALAEDYLLWHNDRYR
jgi:hypothetical protein